MPIFHWAKQTLAHVAGTQEPVYGPNAIRSVADEAAETPYTEVTREDLKWAAMESTCVETQVFYLTAKTGQTVFVQLIYNNISGIRTTCQFNTKIFYVGAQEKKPLWTSTQLHNHEFSEDMNSFYATDCAIELNPEGDTYTVKSLNDERAIVNLTIQRKAPGFQAGKTGHTYFGDDLAHHHAWGSMRHVFWPRCVGSGTITTHDDGAIDFADAPGLFIHALQGMKPHHLAARWNFANFQGPEHSAVLMQFTTPPSYGSTVVTVGGVAKDGEIVFAGAGTDFTATHLAHKQDTENDWPEPTEIKYTWAGKAKDGTHVEAVLEGALETRLDRIDVMAEVPGFVKKIAGSVAGTRPYIYQYYPHHKQVALKIKTGDEAEVSEAGQLFAEATFIS